MVPCPFSKRRAYYLKGIKCDFLHENAQQNPLKCSPPLNLPKSNANQVPFPFDLNYYHYLPLFSFPDVPVPTTYVNTTSSPQTLAESQYLDINFSQPPHVNKDIQEHLAEVTKICPKI